MEFPDLGKHCAEPSCHQLDFLPLKCDACEQVFCKNHMRYQDHNCRSAYKKDVQVPVCPLCGKPVPVPRGETPDIKVGEHIDRDCQSDPAKKKRKAYANRCSVPKCKQHELMPVICPNCKQNFCLRHRHTQDHDCKGFQGSGRAISNSGYAALQRAQAQQSTSKKQNSSKTVSHPPQRTLLHGLGRELDSERRSRQQNLGTTYQNNMSEDEALARALQLSQQEAKPMTQEEKDLALARQLQKEEEEQRRQRRRQQQNQRQSNSESSCHVS